MCVFFVFYDDADPLTVLRINALFLKIRDIMFLLCFP